MEAQAGSKWKTHNCILLLLVLLSLDLPRYRGTLLCLRFAIEHIAVLHLCRPIIIDSAENATPTQSTKSNDSNYLVQTQIQPKSQFEFVPRDIKESEVLDLADFVDTIFSVEWKLSYVLLRLRSEVLYCVSVLAVENIFLLCLLRKHTNACAHMSTRRRSRAKSLPVLFAAHCVLVNPMLILCTLENRRLSPHQTTFRT